MTPRRSLQYDTSTPRFDVYLFGQLVGTLGEHGPDVWFRYLPELAAIADEDERSRWAISVRLPLRAEPYGHTETLAFFDNLLIESDLRAMLARQTKHDVSDVPGLLGVVAGECAPVNTGRWGRATSHGRWVST